MRCALLLVAACGDNLAAPVDAVVIVTPDASDVCSATFAGNFADASMAPRCATVDQGVLAFAIPVPSLAASLPVQIALGTTPSPGFYSSETIATWSARVGTIVGTGACIYSAGNAAVPPGDFQLVLSAITEPHGSLHLALPVLASPGTSCGDGDVETVSVAF